MSWVFRVGLTAGLGAFLASGSTVQAQRCLLRWDARFGASGINGEVLSLTATGQASAIGPALFAGGWFTIAGGRRANHVARWDGQRWSSLGRGVNDAVDALAIFDNGEGEALYVGGGFSEAGGKPAPFVAKWDGQAWSSMDRGFSGGVFALHAFDDGDGAVLYAGGGFLSAGETRVNRIARWTGQKWLPLASGLSTTVLTLTHYDDGNGPALYAGGTFRTTGDGKTTLNRVAKWDGARWHSLGEGLPGRVQAFAVYDDGSGPKLYAGGFFRKNQGAPSDRVAQWDGREWSAVGGDMNGNVFTLQVADDGAGPKLFAGGNFTMAEGRPARGLARWGGQIWKQAGEVDDLPRAMVVFDDGPGPALFVGGAFGEAGGQVAEYVARLGCSVCDRIRTLTVRCRKQRQRVKAVIRSPLREGTQLTLTLDPSQARQMVVDEQGRGQVVWKNVAPGLHKVCVKRCPRLCRQTTCEP